MLPRHIGRSLARPYAYFGAHLWSQEGQVPLKYAAGELRPVKNGPDNHCDRKLGAIDNRNKAGNLEPPKLGCYHWINQNGYLSVAEVSAIAREVWD
jgi:hypothetical protein